MNPVLHFRIFSFLLSVKLLSACLDGKCRPFVTRKRTLLLFFFLFHLLQYRGFALRIKTWYNTKAVLIASDFSWRGHHYINERLFQSTTTISIFLFCYFCLFVFFFA